MSPHKKKAKGGLGLSPQKDILITQLKSVAHKSMTVESRLRALLKA